MAETNKGQIQDVEDKVILLNNDIQVIDSKIDTLQTYLNNRLENVTNSLVTIGTEHSAIHKGYAYVAQYNIPELEYGEKTIFMYVSPLTLFTHIKGISMSLQGATCKASIIEDSTMLTSGVLQTDLIHKLNLNSTNEAQSKIYLGATYENGKTHDSIIVHASTEVSGKSSSSGEFNPQEYFEYVMKNNNTKYFYEIENICPEENTAYNIQTRFLFYEEPVGIET